MLRMREHVHRLHALHRVAAADQNGAVARERFGVAGDIDHALRPHPKYRIQKIGIAAGARPVLAAFTDEVSKRNLQNVTIAQTGCIGICQYEPVVEVYEPGKEKVTYVKMTPEMAVKVVNDHLVNGNVVTEYTIGAKTK